MIGLTFWRFQISPAIGSPWKIPSDVTSKPSLGWNVLLRWIPLSNIRVYILQSPWTVVKLNHIFLKGCDLDLHPPQLRRPTWQVWRYFSLGFPYWKCFMSSWWWLESWVDWVGVDPRFVWMFQVSSFMLCLFLKMWFFCIIPLFTKMNLQLGYKLQLHYIFKSYRPCRHPFLWREIRHV